MSLQRKEKKKSLQAKDSALRKLEESLGAKIADLQRRLKNTESELESRKTELRETNKMLQARDSDIRELEEGLSAKLSDLQTELSEKEKLLKSRDWQLETLRSEIHAFVGLINEMKDLKARSSSEFQRLESELKEKKLLLAKEESAFWRAIRRRNLWKRRLGRIGDFIIGSVEPQQKKEVENQAKDAEKGEQLSLLTLPKRLKE
jgi:chromosome segregation ATPase